ncbi:unnamed protein product [Cuscuta epithymum]|uniref:Pectate lyase n=2 Tax=Cuscuta epithymum TaxID=186058 RepID=A0AAV0F3C0_9ASTE|nr:unnamed protein product [Cuscuta epithymum]
MVAQEVQRRLHESVTRRRVLEATTQTQPCLTGNPIDDCWKCDRNWANNRQRLADCGIGFGKAAIGGKGGQFYTVSDPSDNPSKPTQGTLRHAVIQNEPLWIIFAADMTIKLKAQLVFNSFKTVDGRGAAVHVTGNGCITIKNATNIIIHNIFVHGCLPSSNEIICSTPTKCGSRGRADGDGITIRSSSLIWIDHCDLSSCTDGLLDVTRGSTAVTISNCYFSHHDKVMLLGHTNGFLADSHMQVTVAFNHFGEGCVQRMPRCRRGYFHVVNNDYTEWKMYAIGGSDNPTINSQGNRFIAPNEDEFKEVTKRIDTNKDEWKGWNWRTQGDMLVNGAVFVPSGDGLSNVFTQASSLDPHSVLFMDQLITHVGVLPLPAGNNPTPVPSSGGTIPVPSDGGATPIPYDGGTIPVPSDGGATPLPYGGDGGGTTPETYVGGGTTNVEDYHEGSASSAALSRAIATNLFLLSLLIILNNLP